jgi:hypothetical protein
LEYVNDRKNAGQFVMIGWHNESCHNVVIYMVMMTEWLRRRILIVNIIQRMVKRRLEVKGIR